MGPWWMTVAKLELELRQLQEAMTALREERPELWRTSAVTVAEAEIQRAAADVRRACRPGSPEPLLAGASATLALARGAVGRADQLAGIGRRRTLVPAN
jgi:hypothetical protein